MELFVPMFIERIDVPGVGTSRNNAEHFTRVKLSSEFEFWG